MNFRVVSKRRCVDRLSVSKSVRSMEYFSWSHIGACLSILLSSWRRELFLLRHLLVNRRLLTLIVQCWGISILAFVLSFWDFKVMLKCILIPLLRHLSSLLNFTKKSFLSFFFCHCWDNNLWFKRRLHLLIFCEFDLGWVLWLLWWKCFGVLLKINVGLILLSSFLLLFNQFFKTHLCWVYLDNALIWFHSAFSILEIKDSWCHWDIIVYCHYRLIVRYLRIILKIKIK